MTLVQATKQSIQTLNIKWVAARSAWDVYRSFNCECDFCHKHQAASGCKVFHSVPPNRGMSDVKNGVPFLKDHITVCFGCRFYIDNNWMSCRCCMNKPPMYL